MRYLKIIVFVLMFMALAIPPGGAQETAEEPATAAEELPLEQFWKEFLTALQANNIEQLQQLITDNPTTAEQVQQRLTDLGKGTGEQSAQARILAEIVRKFRALNPVLESLLKEGEQAYYTANYQAALEKLQAGLNQARVLNNKQYISQYLGNIGLVYNALGQYQRALEHYEQVLAIYRELGDRRGEGDALTGIGTVYWNLSQYQRALEHHEQPLVIHREIGNRHGEGDVLDNIGSVYWNMGQYQRALRHHEQALAIYREFGDQHGEGNALTNIGNVYAVLGQYLQALEQYEHSLVIHRELSDRRGEGHALTNIGNLYLIWGQYERALEQYEQTLTINQELGNRHGEGVDLTNIGSVYWNMGQYQRALEQYEQALAIAREIGNRDGEGAALTGIGTVYQYLGQYQWALEHHEQALGIHREIGDRRGEGADLTNIGIVYWSLGQYPRALEHHEQALGIHREIGDRRGKGADLGNIGIVYWSLGQYPLALEQYEQALAIHREIGDHRGEGAGLLHIGVVYADLGQYQKALEHYKQALAIHRKLGDRRGEGADLTNIGIVYWSLGQYPRALEHHEQALVIHRELGDRRGEGDDLDNIGAVYADLGQYQQALEHHEQALAIERKIGDRRGEGVVLGSIGAVYGDLGQYQQALEYHEQALAIAREIGDRDGEETALTNIGLEYKNLGQYQEASTAFQDSLKINEALGTLDGLWLAQRGLASVEVRLKQPKSAIEHYEQALDTIEALRTGLTKKEQKLSFMRRKLYVYDELIDLLQDLHPKHSDKSYDRKALETFERKQGRAFLEEMGQSGARLFAGLPEAISQKELDLENQLAQTRKQLVDERSKIIMEQNKELIKSLEDREKTLLSEQEALQTTIKTDYPDYYVLRYPKPAALSELQQNILQPGELLLVYGVMQEQTVLWTVSKQDFRLVTLDISEEDLQKEVEAFRAAPNAIIEAVSSGQQFKAIRLADDTLDDMAQAGYALYQYLFPKAIHSLVAQALTLYIIPTGPLYGLPFEALVTEAPEEEETPHYLLQDHSITYLSSASLLKVLRDAQARRKQTTTYPLLAFADPEYPETCQATRETSTRPLETARTDVYLKNLGKKTCFSKQDELPETKIEAEAIAKILDAPDDSVPLQLRERASRSNLFRLNEQERLDDYRYLLFSAHAILPGEVDHVNQPAIVLSFPETEGYLTMADTFALQLNAGLVALSACNTGRGEQVRGEGIMGLTRAFMYAGTPAVGVTLWSVDSKASSEINTRFFRHLKADKSLANALRQAKLDLLAEAEEDSDLEHFRHPFFWAPFVVFGDASSK